jgi:hypothetical protein
MNQSKKQVREDTEKALAEFLKKGGSVQVVEPKKTKKSGQNWKK